MAAYARVAVSRTGGFTFNATEVSAHLAANATFPQMAGGTGGTVTHFGIGTDATGVGKLLFFGAVSPNLVIAAGSTPILDTSTKVQSTSPDNMTDNAALDFLKLLLNNTTWAGVGDATGLVGSTSAGNVYLSLHTSSPGETGNQSTNEISYT